uniref:C2H2-type domain-containing protein n=1 Tax=Pelusios castaneus TaxID=367368 RepID=A0A8C8SC42_9SAUR
MTANIILVPDQSSNTRLFLCTVVDDGTASKEKGTPQEGCLEKLEGMSLVKPEEVLQSPQQRAAARLANPAVVREETSTQCGRDVGLLKGFVVQPGEKPFACAECGKSFRLKGNLVKHLRSHAKVRPYKCTECEKSFTRQDKLTDHFRTHTGERPYVCTQCGKSFKSKLNNHYRVHTGERPFKCTDCGKSFMLKKSLVKHQQNHGKDGPKLGSPGGSSAARSAGKASQGSRIWRNISSSTLGKASDPRSP